MSGMQHDARAELDREVRGLAGTIEKTRIEMAMTNIRKLVPQRGWSVDFVARVLDGQLSARLERVDRLVLGAVVLEHAPHLLPARDRRRRRRGRTPGGSTPSTRLNTMPSHPGEIRQDERQPEEEPDAEDERARDRAAESELRLPVGGLLRARDARRFPRGASVARAHDARASRRRASSPSSSSIAVSAEYMSEPTPRYSDSMSATAPRKSGSFRSGTRRVRLERLLLDRDRAVGLADGGRDHARRAHHHALDDRLAAELSGRSRGPSGGHRAPVLPRRAPPPRESVGDAAERSRGLLAPFAILYLRLKRSTRPAVSTSFCLPVKNGWQIEQISTWSCPAPSSESRSCCRTRR